MNKKSANTYVRVTYLLILVNVISWIVLQGQGRDPAFEKSLCQHALYPFFWNSTESVAIPHCERYGLRTFGAMSPSVTTFLHGSWAHLLANMWFLWAFGRRVESKLGHLNFFLLYLVCGYLSSLVQVGFERNDMVPLVGSSGAIAGIMGAYVLLFPRERLSRIVSLIVNPLPIPIPLRNPAWLGVGLWFSMQVFGSLMHLLGREGDVAYEAHVGGFLVGLVSSWLWLLMSYTKAPAAGRRPVVGGPAVGVDLGTRNAYMVVVDEESGRDAGASESSAGISSAVALAMNGEMLVGRAAEQQAVNNPENTFMGLKRLLGCSFDVSSNRGNPVYRLRRSEDGEAVAIETREGILSPVQLLMRILTGLGQLACGEGSGSAKEMVVAVPPTFNHLQRRAVRELCLQAGSNARRIVGEDTAAALSYWKERELGDATLAVYCLGAGCFAVSIVEMRRIGGRRTLRVLATCGDTFLGGEEFDERVTGYLRKECERLNGDAPSEDPETRQRLKEAAEAVKLELSSSLHAEVSLPFVMGIGDGTREDLVVNVSREKLECLVGDLVERTIYLCDKVLRDAKRTKQEIDGVILVGRQTRMPLVERRVGAFFGRPTTRHEVSGAAVAKGAAMVAEQSFGSLETVAISEVTALSLACETPDGSCSTVIESNTVVPAEGKVVLATERDGQERLEFHVRQSAGWGAGEWASVGRFEVASVHSAPKGVVRVETVFAMDEDGLLSVRARDLATNRELPVAEVAGEGARGSFEGG